MYQNHYYNNDFGNWERVNPEINREKVSACSHVVLVNKILRIVIFSLEFYTNDSGTNLILFNPPRQFPPKINYSGISLVASTSGGINGVLYLEQPNFRCTLINPTNSLVWYSTFFCI